MLLLPPLRRQGRGRGARPLWRVGFPLHLLEEHSKANSADVHPVAAASVTPCLPAPPPTSTPFAPVLLNLPKVDLEALRLEWQIKIMVAVKDDDAGERSGLPKLLAPHTAPGTGSVQSETVSRAVPAISPLADLVRSLTHLSSLTLRQYSPSRLPRLLSAQLALQHRPLLAFRFSSLIRPARPSCASQCVCLFLTTVM